MMRHFFTQGIGLSHAIDYYYLLQQEMSYEEKQEAVKVLKLCGMYKFYCAVLLIEREMLGLDKNTDLAKANQKAGKLVLHEMLKGGNFGHKYKHNRYKEIVAFINQMKYNLKYITEFPSEPLARPLTLVWNIL